MAAKAFTAAREEFDHGERLSPPSQQWSIWVGRAELALWEGRHDRADTAVATSLRWLAERGLEGVPAQLSCLCYAPALRDRPRVAPNQVRQLHAGEAFLIQAGRAVKLSVLQAPVPAQVQEEASALRATAMSAAEPVYVEQGIAGAPPQGELWQPSQPALDQPDPAPLLALAASSEDGQTTAPVGAPVLPATPRPRILLALRQAIAQRDQALVAAVIQTGQREQPDWDPTAELARLRPVRPWRRWRRPAFPRFLARVGHLGRVRGG